MVLNEIMLTKREVLGTYLLLGPWAVNSHLSTSDEPMKKCYGESILFTLLRTSKA